jgi:hypothetical protein
VGRPRPIQLSLPLNSGGSKQNSGVILTRYPTSATTVGEVIAFAPTYAAVWIPIAPDTAPGAKRACIPWPATAPIASGSRPLSTQSSRRGAMGVRLTYEERQAYSGV